MGMARQLEYHDGARADSDDSFDWYAKRSEEAAIGFVSAVDEAMVRIMANPERCPKTLAECRCCSLKKYPFRVVFREEYDRIVVIAVAHAKRRPGYWKDRR